jgi:dTDP-4-amino-4,6-dideoxygalactose transaminase
MMSSSKVMSIGGEFWFDLNLFKREPESLDECIMLSGGQCSINFIIGDMKLKKEDVVLLPSYLCPSILHWFKRKGINYIFYKIKKDLSIDLDDLEFCLNKLKPKAVFFINYFGFHHSKETRDFLTQLKLKGIKIIEDAVQMLWVKENDKFIGNYVFNSLRKFVPIDGSFLLCEKRDLQVASPLDNYLELSYKSRMLKTLYQCFDIGTEEEFLNCFELAEKAYYDRKEIQSIDEKSLELIKKLDIDFIKSRRVNNYKYLCDKLKKAGIEYLFEYNSNHEIIPLGLPIIIENRDSIRKDLRRKGIYCPVHWDIRDEEWVENFKDSYYIADKILTIPIDQRYETEDMDRLLNELICLHKIQNQL